MAKKGAYSIVITREDDGYIVDIPDFAMGTQGDSVAEAMEMARDAIGIIGIDMEDRNKSIPEPGSAKVNAKEGDIVTLVDVDFTEYRKRNENRAVRKNVTIPYRVCAAADKEDINYSKVLTEALEKLLGMRHTVTY